MKWEGTEVTINSMIREFKDLCAGKSTNVTIDFTSPNRNIPLEKIAKMESIQTVGDIGFYYLKYIPYLCNKSIDIKIPCIKRNKEETIESYIKKMRIPNPGIGNHAIRKIRKMVKQEPKYEFRNHWIEHNGTVYQKDAKWDKCYPKFKADSLYEALGQYWESYYAEANQLQKEFPTKVKIFNMEALNSEKGQTDILEFCGFSNIITENVHTNKSC